MKRLLSFIVCALFILAECVVLNSVIGQFQGVRTPRSYTYVAEEDKRLRDFKLKETKAPWSKK